MCKAVSFIFSFLFAAFFAATAVAADENRAPAEQTGRMTSLKGEITEIDAAENQVKVKENDHEITIEVTDKTIITAGKTKRTLADLKTGDKIVARFIEEGGRLIARSIRVATLGKGGGMKPAEAAGP